MPKLTIEKGPHAGREYQVKDGMVLGRDRSCSIQFMESEVSRFHARIRVREDGVYIEDLGSVNGTWIGDTRLDKEYRLEDRELFRIGAIKLSYMEEDVSPESKGGYFLKVLDGPYTDREFRVRSEMVIGRDKSCDIQLLEAEISREHARLSLEGDRHYVEDLDSSNGVLVNRRRIDSEELNPGDILTVGYTSMLFSGTEVEVGDYDIDELKPEGDTKRPETETAELMVKPLTRFGPGPLDVMVPAMTDVTVEAIFLDTIEGSIDEYLSKTEKDLFRFQFATDEASIDRAGEAVSSLVERTPLDSDEQNKIVAAIREALGNAARHGNRYDPEKCIGLDLSLEPDRLVVSVIDEGCGFNHESLFSETVTQDAVDAARERIAAGGIGGLGFILMKKCVDEIEFNVEGNRITMTKNYPEN